MKVYTETSEKHILSFWKKSKPSVSTDVEILLACQEAKSSNQAIVASSLSPLNQQVSDPDSSFSNTTDTTTSPPPTKKSGRPNNSQAKRGN